MQTRWRRRVAPLALAWNALARLPPARSRLWVMAVQAALASKCPEGRCASGPSIRSAKVVSMMA
jgi:hypothetical protein